MKLKSLGLFAAFLFLFVPAIPYAEAGFQFAESSINSDPGDWLSLDERQVFYKRLTHAGDGHEWTMKIGKGGQIYSIRLPGLGELIANQRVKNGQWIDEVFQHTLPMPPQKSKTGNNTVVDGDIHQAGYYTKSDLDGGRQIRPRSVYSPLFAYQAGSNAVSYISWPQHAHLPRRYAENLVLIRQSIVDLGEGVIEVAVEFNKWGGARHEKFTLPWSAFRTQTVPVQILSNPDGSYRSVTQNLLDLKTRPRFNQGETGGWMAFVSSVSPSAQGIGIVYGKQPLQLDNKNAVLAWGNYGPPKSPELGGTVGAVYRSVNLDTGETLYYRYYLVLGTLAHIQAKANELESRVELKKISRTREQAGRLPVCADANKVPRRECAGNARPLFFAQENFTPDARPLFLLQDSGSGEHMITDDPYEISFDPTDETTKYVDFLGWAVPKPTATDTCKYQALKEAAATLTLRMGKDAMNLSVMRTTVAACAP